MDVPICGDCPNDMPIMPGDMPNDAPSDMAAPTDPLGGHSGISDSPPEPRLPAVSICPPRFCARVAMRVHHTSLQQRAKMQHRQYRGTGTKPCAPPPPALVPAVETCCTLPRACWHASATPGTHARNKNSMLLTGRLPLSPAGASMSRMPMTPLIVETPPAILPATHASSVPAMAWSWSVS
eukprot:358445-Chlamydomonas_euryale.AAC.5